MAKQIQYFPSEENRAFLERLQKHYMNKGHAKKGMSRLVDMIINDCRLRGLENPFNRL